MIIIAVKERPAIIGVSVNTDHETFVSKNKVTTYIPVRQSTAHVLWESVHFVLYWPHIIFQMNPCTFVIKS